MFHIFPFRVKRAYWVFPQNVAHYLARGCTWVMMGSSVHDVALRRHASVRPVVIPRMIRWIDLRA
eukprot:4035344-Pyramimonas_sp.AAC.1